MSSTKPTDSSTSSAGPNWKPAKGTKKREHKSRQTRVEKNLAKAKLLAKARDNFRCRFPACDCGHGSLESSHLRHQGMGGNPTEDRNTTDGLMTLCPWRHRLNALSVDRKTLRYVPLTIDGCDGPVAWEVQHRGAWVEFARESTVQRLGHVHGPLLALVGGAHTPDPVIRRRVLDTLPV